MAMELGPLRIGAVDKFRFPAASPVPPVGPHVGRRARLRSGARRGQCPNGVRRVRAPRLRLTPPRIVRDHEQETKQRHRWRYAGMCRCPLRGGLHLHPGRRLCPRLRESGRIDGWGVPHRRWPSGWALLRGEIRRTHWCRQLLSSLDEPVVRDVLHAGYTLTPEQPPKP